MGVGIETHTLRSAMVRLHSLSLSAAAIFVHFIAFRLKASLAFRIELAGVYRAPAHASRTDSNIVLFGFFDSISDAFSNDPTLSNDKSLGQLEAPPGVDLGEGGSRSDADLSDVQRKWLASQRLQRDAKREASPSASSSGAPLTVERLSHTKWKLLLFLTGIPNKDPSNDLYGARTNMSNRSKDPRNAGLPLGASLPDQPTVEVPISLLPEGICKIDSTAFTTGSEGQWMLSPDGRTIRICMECTGFTRTVVTKGTIQKVFWSDGKDEVKRQTSIDYEIPAGLTYTDINVRYGRPGEIIMGGSSDDAAEMGLITVEKTYGVLGATRKMAVCGKITGEMAMD